MFNEWFERSRFRIIANRYEFVKKTIKCDCNEITIDNIYEYMDNYLHNIPDGMLNRDTVIYLSPRQFDSFLRYMYLNMNYIPQMDCEGYYNVYFRGYKVVKTNSVVDNYCEPTYNGVSNIIIIPRDIPDLNI